MAEIRARAAAKYLLPAIPHERLATICGPFASMEVTKPGLLLMEGAHLVDMFRSMSLEEGNIVRFEKSPRVYYPATTDAATCAPDVDPKSDQAVGGWTVGVGWVRRSESFHQFRASYIRSRPVDQMVPSPACVPESEQGVDTDCKRSKRKMRGRICNSSAKRVTFDLPEDPIESLEVT